MTMFDMSREVTARQHGRYLVYRVVQILGDVRSVPQLAKFCGISEEWASEFLDEVRRDAYGVGHKPSLIQTT